MLSGRRGMVQNDPFAVLLADDFIDAEVGCLQQMVEAYENQAGNYLACMEVPEGDVSSYGILAPEGRVDDRAFAIKGMVEKPNVENAPSRHAVIGRYLLEPGVMKALEHTRPGAGGEIQLTDAIAATINSTPTYGYRLDGQRFDCGSTRGFVEATSHYARKLILVHDHPIRTILSSPWVEPALTSAGYSINLDIIQQSKNERNSMTRFDVTSIGNAIVDVLTQVPDSAVDQYELNRGSMTLIDAERAEYLTSIIGDRVVEAGGSAGNTAVALAGLGAKSAYIGKVANDQLGDQFDRSLDQLGVIFDPNSRTTCRLHAANFRHPMATEL